MHAPGLPESHPVFINEQDPWDLKRSKEKMNDTASEISEPRDLAICTIVSKNYLPFARSLADSFSRCNQGRIFVLLVDAVEGYFMPEDEGFTLIEIEALRDTIPDFDRFCFQYTILELNTAVKPYFLEYLFKKYHLKKLIYFDPDIHITSNLAGLSCLLDDYSIVLTPHLTGPIDDNYKPGEIDMLMSGAYNLGFLALSHGPTTISLLSWWKERLYSKCIHAVEKGLFVDQKWMDLVPGMYDGVFILRSPGYNVAYWNFHCRTVCIEKDGVRVNGEPLIFFHFSGFDPENMGIVSKHQNRYKMSSIKHIQPLFDLYRERLLAHGYRECKNWPYFFGSFQNGGKIPDFARRVYLSLGEKVRRFGNPFSTGENSFFLWLNEKLDRKTPPITRFMYELYKIRSDVQQVFPDLLSRDREGFVAWFLTSGKKEHRLDNVFFSGIQLEGKEKKRVVKKMVLFETVNSIKKPLKGVVKKIFWRSPKIIDKLKAFNTRMNVYFSVPTNTDIRRSMNTVTDTIELGVNIAGYITSESGTGESVRAMIRAMEAVDIPFVLNNIESYSRQNDDSFSSFVDTNPYPVNLIHVNADQVPVFLSQKGQNYFRGRYNIGFWLWELSKFPDEWIPHFRFFNEIWTASSFCMEALSAVSPIPVLKVPISITIDKIRDINRAYFGLESGHVVFLYAFDILSFFDRKNPLAVIHAFKKAFGNERDAVLVLKCSNPDWNPSAMERILKEASGVQVKIIDRYLDKDELHALMNLSDCYISLHRSEGFGLPLAEAMYMGKPVIATAYSANMDFMNINNSFPVKYRLIEIEQDVGPYRKGNVWADPDIEHAAELMRFVYENRERAWSIGKKASEDIRAMLSPAVVGQIIEKRFNRIFFSKEAHFFQINVIRSPAFPPTQDI
jgi:glycosyltransferase involved in cell wall biosynthesis